MALFGCAMTSEARAAGGATLKSCAASFKSVCGHVKPGAGRVQACFDSHIAKLSQPCKNKLTQAASSSRACETDVRKFCGGASSATGIISCMKPRLAEVGKPCKRVLAKLAIQYSGGR
jgi:hypothetical protein